MKKNIFLIPILIISSLYSFSQETRNTLSLSLGYGLEFEQSIYIDFDERGYEVWATPLTNLSLNLAYDYSVNEYLKVGPRLEYEKMNFESFYTDETYANRWTIGLEFLALYPKTSLHAQLGGFFDIGRINCEEFDNAVFGFDYGLIAGPAFQYENIGVALLFQPSFGYYFIASGDSPDSGLIMYPRIVGRISYSF